MESLSIVHLAPLYHPVVGGVENVVRNIAERSSGAGHHVRVVTARRCVDGDSAVPRYEELNGVEIHRLPTLVQYSFGSVMRGLPVLLKQLRPDIIHTHVYRHPHSVEALWLRNKTNAKVVLHSHGPFPPPSEIPKTWHLYYTLFDSIVAPLTLPHYDAIVAVTPRDKQELVARGAPERKIVEIPNGVEEAYLYNTETPGEFRRNNRISEEYVVLCMGRIHPQKRIELLMQAASLLKKEIKSKVKIVIAGPCDLRYAEKLKALATKKNILGQVLFTGPLDLKERCQAYKAADICVSTIFYESFGIALLEAMASGTPVVAMRGAGQHSLVAEGVSGILVDNDKPSAIAHTLETLLTNPEKRLQLSRRGKQAAMKYSWKALMPKYLGLYREIRNRD